MRYCKGFTGLLFVAIMGLVLAGPAVYGIAEAKEVAIGFSGPLSGVAAEYGQDCANGLDMAVNDINAAGGITVGGEKYTLKLVKLDDRIDPTQAVNNCRRLQDQVQEPRQYSTLCSIPLPPWPKLTRKRAMNSSLWPIPARPR